MEHKDLLYLLQHIGTDPSLLVFEDELTGIYNRRFLLNYLQHKVSWDSLESEPVSLLMIDLDYFKEINDTYGHDIGDKTLIWVAKLVKKVSGDKGHAIRYGGDEFMILMPGADNETGLQVGEKLMQQLHEEPIRLDKVPDDFSITLSIGVASAPDHARNSKNLIQKADAALYYAKRFGRNRLASADQAAFQEIFPKTALYQLDKVKITGRSIHFLKVAEILRKFSQYQNQFLVIQGAGGMGKSEFLKTIRKRLPKNKIWQVAVNGIPQEVFRPYYLITNILIEILNQRSDKGTKVLEDMTPKEIYYLSHILPQLVESEDTFHQKDEKNLREQIFATVIHFILKLLDSRPFILFIDDLHYSDKATLFLLRRLLLRQDIPLFICGAAPEIHLDDDQQTQVPLEQFLTTYQQELNISRLNLSPLTEKNIANYFNKIFPSVSLPENFEKTLAKLTQGNPLFINGILRKLVLDEKVTLIEQKWVVKPLEDGYIPESLEEIVSQKIAALDKDDRQLLNYAATFGKDTTLSALTGGSESMETKVQEFIDHAVTQGLISSEHHMNDDTIQFLNNRFLEIVYGAIQEDQKQKLHERIGTHQEVLHDQHLLTSDATLAYHFQLSANREKAISYQESQQAYNNKIFDAEKAMHYTEKKLPDAAKEDVPLDSVSLSQIPGFIHAFLTSVHNIKLYPSGSSAIVDATKQLKEIVDRFLAENQRLNITQAEKVLTANGEPVDITEFQSIAETFVKFLSQLELTGIAFSRGLKEKELTVILESFSRISRKMIDRHFWKRFSTEQRLLHIELKQVRYTDKGQAEEAFIDQEARRKNRITSMHDSAELLAFDQGLDEEDLVLLPQVIRCLLTAASNINLYPPESKTVNYSIEVLQKALQSILVRRPGFTLSKIDERLLANGTKIDITDFKTMADGFLKLMGKIGLSSLTFLKNISSQELKTFIVALGQPTDAELNSKFWQHFARKQKLSGILFDQHLYMILTEQVGIGADQAEPIEEAAVDADADLVSQITVEPEVEEPISEISEAHLAEEDAMSRTYTFLESVAQQLHDLFLKGEETKFQQLVDQLFQGISEHTPQIRKKIIHVCESLLKDLGFASQPRFVELLTDPLMLVLMEEEDPDLLKEISVLLSKATANLIRFSDYQHASRIHTQLRRRQKMLQDSKNGQTRHKEINFIQELDTKTQEILLEDLKSKDPSQLQQATQLLDSLGQTASPVLIEVIKKKYDLRLRQIAVHLLGNLDPKAAKLLKRELVLADNAEDRVRILAVIDNVTHDLKEELAFALGDESLKVRQAALSLAERLDNEDATLLLLDYANHEDPSMVIFAIKSLGKLKSSGAIDGLVSLLDSTNETERLIACCRALGQIADPASIEPLAKIMASGGFFSIRKRKNTLVRATAAFALAQIHHPNVAKVLALYVEDRDPRIRQIAQNRVNS